MLARTKGSIFPRPGRGSCAKAGDTRRQLFYPTTGARRVREGGAAAAVRRALSAKKSSRWYGPKKIKRGSPRALLCWTNRGGGNSLQSSAGWVFGTFISPVCHHQRPRPDQRPRVPPHQRPRPLEIKVPGTPRRHMHVAPRQPSCLIWSDGDGAIAIAIARGQLCRRRTCACTRRRGIQEIR